MNAWAIKIGGSLYDSRYLVEWLHSINEYSAKNIVIIPGGGPFADLVRQADGKHHLDQAHAHNMAVMAMQQYGTFLASLCPNMILANTTEKIHLAWQKSIAAIWEPYEMLREECDLDRSWDITSDSLSVWLARKLELKNLLLVKSSKDVLKEKNIDRLSKKNCIDPYFSEYVKLSKINVHVLHKSELKKFKNLL